MKFKLRKRPRAPVAVGVIDDEVPAKSEQASNAIRLAIFDRRVQGVGARPTVSAGPQRRALEIDAFGALLSREKLAAGHVLYGWSRELDVSAWCIEASGQGHQR